MLRDRVTAFEIPHILEAICERLNAEDICHCRAVCKVWLEIFNPHHWRSVRLVDIDGHSTVPFLSPTERALIRQNAQWIRSMVIRTQETLFLDTPCTRLRTLDCRWSNGFSAQLPDPASPTALDVILWNPGLRLLRIDCHGDMSWSPNKTLLTFLQSPFCGLTSLRLHLYDLTEGFYPVVLVSILQALPHSLRELHIADKRGYSRASCNLDKLGPQHSLISELASQWRPNAVRWFRLMCPFPLRFEYAFLIPFLQSSPLLEDLKLPTVPAAQAQALMTVVGKSCPNLKALHLNLGVMVGSHGGTEAGHFGCLRQSLKSLNVDIGMDIGNCVPLTVLSYSTRTITELKLKEAYYMTSDHIVAILRTCISLQVLPVRGVTHHGGIATRAKIRQLVDLKPWACTRLKSLVLPIACEKAEKDEELAKLVLELFKRIRELEYMRQEAGGVLVLTWYGKVSTLDLKMALSVLNYEMSEKELDWMGLYWS
ncbi:hypothetical protein BGZ99_001710 [Dissophora globulifera]|uniref:F-box domain-containing protein n=1 Tax=Dissophora globulifera TaxID=979702 RepID=A0A9P6RR61_9FUNG|nr:hypothetical protein BGZ99_001710 [Dissophora globulifera]